MERSHEDFPTYLQSSPRMKRSIALANPLLFIRRGHESRLGLHFGAGISHSNAQPALFEHEYIVWHIADGGDLLGRDRQRLRKDGHDVPLMGIGMGNVKVVGLGARSRNVIATFVLHVAFAAGDRSIIVADCRQSPTCSPSSSSAPPGEGHLRHRLRHRLPAAGGARSHCRAGALSDARAHGRLSAAGGDRG